MYRPLLSVIGPLAILLGLVLIFAPKLYLSLYVLEYSADMGFAAQRLGPAVAGLGALLWAARGLPAGPIPATLCFIGACVWATIAATGLFHFASGVATINIVIAGISEGVLAVLFFLAGRQMRNA
ncbi:MAG: hypothetical protein KIH44_012325 [Octadecabacter sp.]|nr:hypothetical protein [Octadecabacter sp.]